jgi:hypothetical protein
MKYRSGEGGVYLCHQITNVENHYRYVIPLRQWRKDRVGVYMSNQASHNLVWQVPTTELYAGTMTTHVWGEATLPLSAIWMEMTSSNGTSIISRRFRWNQKVVRFSILILVVACYLAPYCLRGDRNYLCCMPLFIRQNIYCIWFQVPFLSYALLLYAQPLSSYYPSFHV